MSVISSITGPSAGAKAIAAFADSIATNLNFIIARPLWLGYQTTGQTIANSSTVALGWDTNVVDTAAGHSTVTNNSRYVAQYDGWYDLDVEVTWPATNATGRRIVLFRVNGVVLSAGPQCELPPSASVVTTLSHEYSVFLSTGDYVEAYVLQTSGVSVSLPGAGGQQAFMRVEWMRTA